MTTDKTIIKPYFSRKNKVYGYNTDQLIDRDPGFVKVGETTHEDVNQRIHQQTGTLGVKYNLLWDKIAQRTDGTWFSDKDLHRYFREQGIEQAQFGSATEWFDFKGHPEHSEEMVDNYIVIPKNDIPHSEHSEYHLRPEQEDAINQTMAYFYQSKNQNDQREFLWNAKPRFGKTLTTYDFMRKIESYRTLIVTNRPAIANSWLDDFNRFIRWRKEEGFYFVSDTDSLKGKARTREEFVKEVLIDDEEAKLVAFVSLQDLKGSVHFGGGFEKLGWIANENWDLLVIDEAHEGVDTLKTDKAFDNLNRKFTLHLSGTPFKALSDGKFKQNQIYNWTYVDEQAAKHEWDANTPETNPYANLPELSMFTYQMSELIQERVEKGIQVSEDTNIDFAFDLNEFFKTNENGKFEYEEDIKRFLDNLCEGEMPFSQNKYRNELNHTFWLLSRVDSVKALEKLLKKHPIFKDYEIIIAAGDGKPLENNQEDEVNDSILNQEAIDTRRVAKSYNRVKTAIKKHNKTITLSVGQLTTGVTIPEWTAVFMLNNIVSPALYFQAAFRAQNPHSYTDSKGNLILKERAYVFDFSPDRTLQLYDDYANNLYENSKRLSDDERKENVKELINFFPVIGEDESGKMIEFSAEDIMILPNRIRSREVVRNGFMSNLLFKNIGNIFNAPQEIRDALNQLPEEKGWKSIETTEEITKQNPMVDDYGEIDVPDNIITDKTNNIFQVQESPFGKKLYKNSTIEELLKKSPKQYYNDFNTHTNKATATELYSSNMNTTKTQAKDDINQQERNAQEKITFRKDELSSKYNQIQNDFNRQNNEIEKRQKIELDNTLTQKDKELIDEKYNKEKLNTARQNEELLNQVKTEFTQSLETDLRNSQEEIIKERIEKQETTKKNTEEMEVRDRLRGFTRTIPSALMAYGNKNTTVDNFEVNISDETFLELTSITKHQFQLLRDGWVKTKEDGEPQTDQLGNIQRYDGFFNKAVFNASIQEFFNKKEELSNYYERNDTETIFDYIPLQKTNQQFTPVSMVIKMVDALEEENPGIFSDSSKTFLDPYAKSGLFLSEIARRLFDGLKEEFPNEQERLKHIYEHQLYAIAPTNITYNILLNHIFDGLEGISNRNIIEYDLTEVSKAGKMEETINRLFKKGDF
ncbi:DEAD/DEAH box helicase [Aerococcus kribbianus]|uniref:DEAD/DEAH box helicase family protein n=1 Tax=Aerococcus kribbianus TaxID=2999064 RepID=A0A9X3FNJ8_9LACT|nr:MULTISPECIES: DEAD/DEAH box helicase family protein [unclassified Aerococcus]MCZ0716818.1 DEAD/DEAH box helicase family protein [Aerococcus sp. YH-aer221]MCZ0725106.1 DEAD/DEAH box helicase family protein [Aerococcus sp. YH-aer222]